MVYEEHTHKKKEEEQQKELLKRSIMLQKERLNIIIEYARVMIKSAEKGIKSLDSHTYHCENDYLDEKLIKLTDNINHLRGVER